jgi:tetratricopeptide (TPR) repeat protein
LSLLMVLSLFPAAGFGADAVDVERALHERAKNLYDVGDYRMALNLYEKILAQNPKDGAALDLSGWCLRNLGDRKSAEEKFEEALTWLSGENAVWVLIGLGELYLDGGLYNKAQIRLEEALKASSGNAEAVERISKGLMMAREGLKNAAPATANTLDDVGDRQLESFRAQLTQTAQKGQDDRDEQTDQDILAQEVSVELETPLEETPKETPAEALKEISKEVPKEISKEVSKEVSKETPKTKPKEKPKEKPRGKPKEKPRPIRREVVYGVALGAEIGEVLEALERTGHPVTDEPFTKAGKTYYPLRRLPSRLPHSLTGGSSSGRFYVTAYNGAVLSVIVQLDYGRDYSFDEVKDLLRRGMEEITGTSEPRGLKTAENIFSYEMSLALSRTHGLWLSAVDKANGTSAAEIEHIDLANVSHYWMAGGR